ncbi:hypothetical protein M407DRAFT_243188 [Tulasnella calospora MUT 4182]|uniref:Uncharacterized protein n=1 Tax=Tulasnella calospora MUT 4182 TaxID=1051891 RepID=A0A0C3M2V2_9AGAM|nr:hypothetical protein M407DRAFT_243188 [Tulasnella calospora MUT 4182]
MSRGKTVKKVGRSRDLDERWCYWEEESFSVEAAYFLPPDSTSEYSCGTSEQDIEPNDGSSDPADSVSQTTLSSLVH